MPQIAGYVPHRWSDVGGRLICLWTRSPWSHVELVVDGWCYSSSLRDGGVRRKRIDLDRPWWDVVEAPWIDDQHALDLFARTDGRRYGWTDLITQHVLRLPWQDRRGYLCSEWIAEAARLPNPSYWTPGQVMNYALGRGVRA